MFTRQNSNKGKAPPLVVVAGVFAVVVFYIIASVQRNQSPGSGASDLNTPLQPGVQAPVVNPIDELLKAPDAAGRRDGVAVAVLIDTSGSMSEAVPDGHGGKKAKIEIARQSLVDVVRQSADFAGKHKDRPILLGIYEFSGRDGQPACRQIVPLGAPNAATAWQSVQGIRPSGNTPIGDAMIHVKRDLDRTGMSKLHLLVITDGENNQGYALGDVVSAMARQEGDRRAATYFIAFDVASDKFKVVRDGGGMVLSAANQPELQQTLDYVLTGKILVEAPVEPGRK